MHYLWVSTFLPTSHGVVWSGFHMLWDGLEWFSLVCSIKIVWCGFSLDLQTTGRLSLRRQVSNKRIDHTSAEVRLEIRISLDHSISKAIRAVNNYVCSKTRGFVCTVQSCVQIRKREPPLAHVQVTAILTASFCSAIF